MWQVALQLDYVFGHMSVGRKNGMKTRLLVLALALAPAVFFAGARTDSSTDPFPLTEGTYWVYQGLVRYDEAGTENGAEAKVNWRMEIVRVLHRDDAKASIVKGFPDELNWSTGSAAPRESLLVLTNDGKVYRLDADRAAAAEQKFKDIHAALRDFLEDDDLWFQVPLAQGKKFCDEDSAKRDDDMYCWVVDALAQVSLNNIKGLPADSATSFTLSFRTNPDDSEIELVPGVGIIRYEYHHHGTLADTELKLVEFHAGP
jgi:hypothetical protein